MNKKNIFPNLHKPVECIPTGQLQSVLVELTEETLSDTYVIPSFLLCLQEWCSYDGDDE